MPIKRKGGGGKCNQTDDWTENLKEGGGINPKGRKKKENLFPLSIVFESRDY